MYFYYILLYKYIRTTYPCTLDVRIFLECNRFCVCISPNDKENDHHHVQFSFWSLYLIFRTPSCYCDHQCTVYIKKNHFLTLNLYILMLLLIHFYGFVCFFLSILSFSDLDKNFASFPSEDSTFLL